MSSYDCPECGEEMAVRMDGILVDTYSGDDTHGYSCVCVRCLVGYSEYTGAKAEAGEFEYGIDLSDFEWSEY